YLPTKLGREGRHCGVTDPARHDSVEAGEVRVTVQGEAMHGHPGRDSDPDRCHLAIHAPADRTVGGVDDASAVGAGRYSERVGRHPDTATSVDAGSLQAQISAELDEN